MLKFSVTKVFLFLFDSSKLWAYMITIVILFTIWIVFDFSFFFFSEKEKKLDFFGYGIGFMAVFLVLNLAHWLDSSKEFTQSENHILLLVFTLATSGLFATIEFNIYKFWPDQYAIDEDYMTYTQKRLNQDSIKRLSDLPDIDALLQNLVSIGDMHEYKNTSKWYSRNTEKTSTPNNELKIVVRIKTSGSAKTGMTTLPYVCYIFNDKELEFGINISKTKSQLENSLLWKLARNPSLTENHLNFLTFYKDREVKMVEAKFQEELRLPLFIFFHNRIEGIVGGGNNAYKPLGSTARTLSFIFHFLKYVFFALFISNIEIHSKKKN